MYNTYVTSAITLRTRGSLPFSFNDYSYCSNERYPFAYLSSRTGCSCSCCANLVYRMTVNPDYCCDLYGSRQSSLIQCRKLGFGGFNPCYYSRVPVCDIDRRCYCDKSCGVRQKRGRLRKCLVIEERSESYDLDEVDEADVLVNLLAEDIGDERFRLTKEIKRLVKKPVVEKKENSASKKNRVDSGVLGNEARFDYELVVSSSRKGENRRPERGKKEEEREKKENLNSRMQFEMTKASEKMEERQEKIPFSRKEASQREEEKAEMLRTDEHRHRVRKDGSSCSSYYSFSSTGGDYESDNDVEHNEEKFVGDSSSGYKSKLAIKELAYKEGMDVDEEHEDYKKSTAQESHASSSVVESDFRKKSEKKLTDISIEEKESREGAVQKDSKFSIVQESGHRESSNSYLKYENRKVKSSGSNVVDVEKKQLNKQMHNEVSMKSEQKYKQFVEPDSNDVRKFYGSQKSYRSNDDVSAKVERSSQEAVEENQSAIRLTNREDENQINSQKVSEASNVINVDIRKTSISQQELKSRVKRKEDYSMDIRTSAYDAQKKHQCDEVCECQQLTKKERSSMLKEQSDSTFTKQEGNVNLASGSSLGSKERHSQIRADFIMKEDSRASAVVLEEHDMKKSGTIVRSSSSNRGARDSLPAESTSGITTETLMVQEDAIGSASRLQESSAKYVGEFVDKVRHEISSSEIQMEKKTSKARKEQKSLVQDSFGDSESKESDSRCVSHGSGIKGPSDEIWKLDEPVVEELPKEELQEDANNTGNTNGKRTGRSLWNIIGNIVRLRWSSGSESRSTGGKSSLNQSTSSDTWFSGPEAEDNEGSKPNEQEEEKIGSRNEESSISSTLEGHLNHAEVNAPSSSVVLEISRSDSGGTSNAAAILESSISLPASRLGRSPVVRSVSEAGEAIVPDSGSVEQLGVNETELKRGKLQRKDQIMTDRFDEWEEAYRVEAEQRKLDEIFMKEALLEAQKAGDNWEVPVGAVLVHNGNIIARGCNLVEELRDSTAHAEMICIREASNVLRSWRLSETVLYVTLEPCPMCAGAILQARIDTVVWGAPNKLLGADGSWIRLFPNGNGGNDLEENDKPAAPVHPFHPKITIRRGVLASECAETMQEFFQLRRKKKEKKPESSASTPAADPARLRVLHHHPSKLLRKMHDAFMYCL